MIDEPDEIETAEAAGHGVLSAEAMRRFSPEQRVRSVIDGWLNDLRPDMGNLLAPGEIHRVTSVVGTLGRTCIPPRPTEQVPEVDVDAFLAAAIAAFMTNLPTNLPAVAPEAMLVLIGRLPNLKAALVAALKE